ncbi:mCG146063, partial [Mus musculus]
STGLSTMPYFWGSGYRLYQSALFSVGFPELSMHLSQRREHKGDMNDWRSSTCPWQGAPGLCKSDL